MIQVHGSLLGAGTRVPRCRGTSLRSGGDMGSQEREWPGLTEPACRFPIEDKVGDLTGDGKRA